MAIHWQIKFRSLRANTLYTVNVYDANYTGTPVQLTGADQPFDTSEDDDDDFFAPIRKQSGYLRITDTGLDNAGNAFNWRNMIADTDISRPVTLTDGNGKVRWQGFMQPQNFGVGLHMSPQVIEFPLQCPVSITEGIDINYNQTAIGNFAYLLKCIVESIPTCAPNNFVFQGGDLAMAILQKRIDWQNFILDSGDEGDEGMTMYACLEGMCLFWGWTLREHERTWYFTCADDSSGMPDGLVLTKTELDQVATRNSEFWQAEPIFTSRQVGDIFASTDNLDKQIRGPRNVVITSKANIAADFVVQPFDSLLEETMDEAGWNYGVRYGDQTIARTNDVKNVDRRNFFFRCYGEDAAFWKVRLHEGQGRYGSSINVLAIKSTGSPSTGRFASIQTRYMHGFSNGFFVLHGETYWGAAEYVNTDQGIAYSGGLEMFMALGIGKSYDSAKWWNGRAWQDSYTRFTVTLGNMKPEYFTRYWVDGNHAIDTNIIAVNNALQGYLFVDFFGSYAGVYGDRSFPDTADGKKSFNLKDFAVLFYKNSVTVHKEFPNSHWNEITEKKDKSEGRYIASNSNRTREEYTSDNIFASDNKMKPGFGIVMNTDGSPLTTFAYATVAARPEQHKADRIAAYWSSSKRSIECDLLSNGSIGNGDTASDISPVHILTIDGTQVYPIAINRVWRDDVIRIKNFQL